VSSQPLEPESLDPTSEPMPPRPVRDRADRGEHGLTPDGRLKSGKLAGLSLYAAIWTVGWPVLVDSVLNSLVGLTDTMVAAAISPAATDAIGNAAYILWFCGLFMIALDVGATALISRSVGAGRWAVANAAVGQTMILAVVTGVAVGAMLLVLAGPIAAVMGMSPEGEALFRSYMRLCSLDVPLMGVLYAGIACLRGSGDSFRPMRAMILVNLINLGLAWVLSGADYSIMVKGESGQLVRKVVVENPFPFNLGMLGIGVGMMLGHAAGAAMILRALITGKSGLKLRRHRLRPHWHTMRRIVKVGFPNFLETLGMWIGNFPIILMAGWIGKDLVGAHILAVRIEAFSFQPGFAIGIAAAALAGQYLGAGSPRLAKRAVLICTGMSAGVMGVMGVCFILFARPIVGVLSAQDVHLAVTPRLLEITGLVQVPFAAALVFRQAMRGAGDVKVVMWITWVTTYAFRLPLAYALSGVAIPLPGGGRIENPFKEWVGEASLAGLWVGLCVEIVLRAGVFAARFWEGGWTRARV
jgi:putative MATE family efflux protein